MSGEHDHHTLNNSKPLVPDATKRQWLNRFAGGVFLVFAALAFAHWIGGAPKLPYGVAALAILAVVASLVWATSTQLREIASRLCQIAAILRALSRRQDESFRVLAQAINETIAEALAESITEHRAAAGGTNRLAPRRRRRQQSSHSLTEGFMQYLAGRDDQRREQEGSG